MSSCEYDTKDIALLIQQLREKDALIAERTAERDALVAEKDAMLNEEKDEIKPLPSIHGEDDEFLPHGEVVAGSDGKGRVDTFAFDDYVHEQKSLRRKSHRSQKSKSSTLDVDGGGGMVQTAEENLIDGDGGRERTAEEKRVIRELSRKGAIEGWGDIVDECQLDGDETGRPHHHHQSGNIAWYLPPVQRQRWFDDQVSVPPLVAK